jgi:hypothetical protein
MKCNGPHVKKKSLSYNVVLSETHLGIRSLEHRHFAGKESKCLLALRITERIR